MSKYSKYYAIYDLDKQKYFVTSNSITVKWSSSSLFAKWFYSKRAAKTFIRMNKWLQQKKRSSY